MRASRRIVVVGDDRVLRELLREGLEAEGYAVAVCASGDETMSLVERLDGPVVILADLEMLDLSAWLLVDLLRSDPRSERIPIALITHRAPIAEIDGIVVFGMPRSWTALVAWCNDWFSGVA